MGKNIRIITKVFGLIVTFLLTIVLFATIIPNWLSVNRQGELSLPHNNYNIYNFTDGDFRSYEDNLYTSCLGVDLSSLDNVTSFETVKKQGIEFVYLRVGYRGTSTGIINKDKKFETYYKAAKQAGFKIGVYFFSQASNNDELIEEVNFILENIKDKEIDLPIAYDFEYAEDDEARVQEVSSDILTSNIKLFSSMMEENNYDSIIYLNKHNILVETYNLDELFTHKIWYAQYASKPRCKYPFEIWQYSEETTVQGIEKPCDINIMLIKKEVD